MALTDWITGVATGATALLIGGDMFLSYRLPLPIFEVSPHPTGSYADPYMIDIDIQSTAKQAMVVREVSIVMPENGRLRERTADGLPHNSKELGWHLRPVRAWQGANLPGGGMVVQADDRRHHQLVLFDVPPGGPFELRFKVYVGTKRRGVRTVVVRGIRPTRQAEANERRR